MCVKIKSDYGGGGLCYAIFSIFAWPQTNAAMCRYRYLSSRETRQARCKPRNRYILCFKVNRWASYAISVAAKLLESH